PSLSVPSGVTLAAVINKTMARRFFGEQNPIGKRFRFREGRLKDTPVEIIGLAKDAKYEDLREPMRPIVYLSYFQCPQEVSGASDQRVLWRGLGDSSATAAAIQRCVREFDPQIQVFNLQTMNEVVDATLTQERFVAQLGGFFSLC